MHRRHILLGLAALPFAGSTALRATESESPALRIDGQIAAGKEVVLQREEIEKLGLSTLRTSTPWHQGVQTFEGIEMQRLMDAVGAKGSTLEVVALNKYRTMIPMDDFPKYKPILALKRDGQYMAVRDKGPFFVIYPYDSDAALRSERYYGRSAWQVAAITVI